MTHYRYCTIIRYIESHTHYPGTHYASTTMGINGSNDQHTWDVVGSWRLGGENLLLITPYRLKNDNVQYTHSKHVFYLTTSDIRTQYLNSFDRWHFSQQSTAAVAAATTHISSFVCVWCIACVLLTPQDPTHTSSHHDNEKGAYRGRYDLYRNNDDDDTDTPDEESRILQLQWWWRWGGGGCWWRWNDDPDPGLRLGAFHSASTLIDLWFLSLLWLWFDWYRHGWWSW